MEEKCVKMQNPAHFWAKTHRVPVPVELYRYKDAEGNRYRYRSNLYRYRLAMDNMYRYRSKWYRYVPVVPAALFLLILHR